MRTRAFAISDLHADWSTYGVPRHDDVRRAVMGVAERACDERVDAVFMLGDLANPEDTAAAVRAVALGVDLAVMLHAAGVPLIAIPGNHDVIEDGRGHTMLTPLAGLPGVHLFERGAYEQVSPRRDGTSRILNIVALPFTPSSHPYDPRMVLSYKAPKGAQATFVLSHLAVAGIQPGEETSEMPRGREVLFPLEEVGRLAHAADHKVVVLQGHYHRAQTFVAPQGYDIHVVGSIAKLTMSEEHNAPGYLVLEVP